MLLKNQINIYNYLIYSSSLIILMSTTVYSQTAYIPNKLDNTVSVIDVSTNTVTNTIPVGSNPYGVAVSEDGARVYITNNGDSSISVISTFSNTVISTIPVGFINGGICVSPDGTKLYVTGGNKAVVVNTISFTITDTLGINISSSGAVTSPDGSKVYIAGGDSVHVFDAINNSLLATIPVDQSAIGIAVNMDGSKVYVACYSDGNINVINTVNNTVIDTIDVGLHPIALCVSPDGRHVYVSNRDNFEVSVIDTVSNNVITTIDIADRIMGIDVSPDGSKVYVANYGVGAGGNSVFVINTTTNSVADTITVGQAPVAFGKFISTYTATGFHSVFDISNVISVFPNPTIGHFTILLPPDIEEILIADILGKEIFKLLTPKKEINYNIQKSGIFLILVKSKLGMFTKKLIVNSDLEIYK